MLWQSDKNLLSLLENRKQYGEIIFTNGCFDILHPAHIKLFEFCKSLTSKNFLIVGLNSDDSVKRIKGESRPIHNEEYRKTMLEAIKYVDYVTIFNEDTPELLIQFIRPDILVKGGDYQINTIVGAKFVQDIGGKVIVFNYIEGYSSSKEIERIRNG